MTLGHDVFEHYSLCLSRIAFVWSTFPADVVPRRMKKRMQCRSCCRSS